MKLFNSHKNDNRMGQEFVQLGRLPNGSRAGIEYKRVSKVNRYLQYQESRLRIAKNEGKWDKVVLIGFLLLKNSKSYQTVLFHRVVPKGYGSMDQIKARRLLESMMNKCRRGDWQLMLERFYIQKKNGNGRPIGSPTLESRVMSKALTDLITFMFEGERNVHQHAYRHNHGVGSALSEVVEKLKKDPKDIFEFDLKAFFNNIRGHGINMKMSEKSEMLADLVYGMLVRIHYVFRELKPETELQYREKYEYVDKKLIGTKMLTRYKGKGINTIIRRGMPQGLSVSPLLATLALDKTNIPDDVTMYADDGLYIGNHGDDEFVPWVSRLEDMGVQIEFTKSGFCKNQFTFLGVEINVETKTLKYNESIISGNDPQLNKGLKGVAQFYGKKPEGGTGEIVENSYLHCHPGELRGGNKAKTLGNGIGLGVSGKGYRYFLGHGIYDVISSSSRCCETLLFDQKQLKPLRVLPLLVPKTRNYLYPIQKKNGYYEELFDESQVKTLGRRAEFRFDEFGYKLD